MARSSQLLIEIGEGLSMVVGFPTISTWKNSGRPQRAKQGTLGFNEETGDLEYYDGESWFRASMKSA